MALTKDERKALELARERIATSRAIFICWALRDVGKEYRLPVARLKRYIATRLDGSNALYGWQINHGLGDRGPEQRRKDRLAWIDWMLDQPEV